MASGVMGKVRNGFAQTRDEAGRFGQRSKEAFKEFALGAGMMTAGLVGFAAMKPALDASKNFAKEIALVATEVDEATFSTKDMNKIALEMAGTFGKLPTEEAQALFDVVGFGANTAESAMAALTAANKLAVAGNTDVKTAVSAVTGTMNAYSLTAESSADISDSFFKAMTLGKTTVAELANALPRATGAANSLGISYDVLLAATATLTSRNVKAEEAVTGLKAAMVNIQKPTSEAAAEAARLGIKFDAATLRAKGLPGMLSEIQNNSKFTADTFGILFSSAEAGNAILQLTSGGMETFSSNLDAMQSRAGATDKAFAKMSSTLAFQEDKFKAMIEVAKIFIGDILAPMAMKSIQTAQHIVGAFNRIPKPIKALIVHAAMAASTLLVVAGAMRSAMSAVSILASGLSVGGGALAFLGSALLPVVAIIGALALAFFAVRKAFNDNIGGLATKFDGIIEPIKTAWEALVQLFTTGTLDEALTQELLNGDNTAVNFAVKIKQAADNLMNFFDGISKGFMAGIEQAQPVFDAFGKAIDDLGTAFGGLVGPVSEVDAGFGEAGAAGQTTGGVLAKLAVIIINGLTIAINVLTGFVAAWDMVSGAMGEVFDSFAEVGTAIGEVISALSGGSTEAVSAGDVFKAVGRSIAGSIGFALHVVGTIISVVAGLISDLAVLISGVVDIIAGLFSGNWARVWGGFKKVAAGAILAVVDLVLGLVETLANALDGLGKMVGKDFGAAKALKDFRATAKEYVRGGMGVEAPAVTSGVKNGVGVTPTPVMGAGFIGPPTAAQAGFGGGSKSPGPDPAVAAAAAARAAVGALPPTHIDATLQVDSDVFARLVVKANASDGSRRGDPTNVDVG